MTISSILGFRGATTTAAPAPSLGLRPHFHNAQHRGDIWIHSGDGWKGGKKGDSAALSALTLLAFLFFLNILQSCLQDMQVQPTVVVANSARREEVPTMVAVPMATPMPMPMPMPPAQAPARAKRHADAEDSKQGEELARHRLRVQQQRDSARQSEAGWEMVSVVRPAQRRRPGHGASNKLSLVEVGLSPRRTSTAQPSTPNREDEKEEVETVEDRVVSITPSPVNRARPGQGADGVAMVRVSSSSLDDGEDDSSTSVSGSASSGPAANKQEEYELSGGGGVATTERIETATVPMALPMAVPMAVPVAMLPLRPPGTVVRFVPLASTVRGVFSMLAAPLLRMVQPGAGLGAALSTGLGQGLREGLRAAVCCDLVVCEAHRLGSIGGAIGERVATTVSSVVRWACGEAQDGELTKAAAQGRSDGEGCRPHIEQCERRAGRRTAVSTVAALVEAYITRRA